ncbi:MAG TPA: glycosyltransferase family 9 protein [Bacteroidales bacterium]|nr:glycosyltransferase family 9 protein [Bacteroidales bacterium]
MKKIIVSRTDNLGDVVLTLPVAGLIKKYFPDVTLLFLGKSYTRPLLESCVHVDEFLDWDLLSADREASEKIRNLQADAVVHVFPVKEIARLARKAGIPLRIGTSHRWYHWLNCNKLVHYSRKNSALHEAQLNLKLLEPLGITQSLTLKEIPAYYGLKVQADRLPSAGGAMHLILHPKSKGSAREWGLDHYAQLVRLLPAEKFKIYITGTREEGLMMKDLFAELGDRVSDMTGKFTLSELIRFIASCDALVAASTGPLHIAAALGKKTVGIYAPMRPIFPQRWAPLGENAGYLSLDKKCKKCRGKKECECIRSITPQEVASKLLTR